MKKYDLSSAKGATIPGGGTAKRQMALGERLGAPDGLARGNQSARGALFPPPPEPIRPR